MKNDLYSRIDKEIANVRGIRFVHRCGTQGPVEDEDIHYDSLGQFRLYFQTVRRGAGLSWLRSKAEPLATMDDVRAHLKQTLGLEPWNYSSAVLHYAQPESPDLHFQEAVIISTMER